MKVGCKGVYITRTCYPVDTGFATIEHSRAVEERGSVTVRNSAFDCKLFEISPEKAFLD